jgi:hypothetical protein
MVWCPVHSRHFNEAKGKDKHAYGDVRLPDGCDWMKDYLSHSWSTIHRLAVGFKSMTKSK